MVEAKGLNCKSWNNHNNNISYIKTRNVIYYNILSEFPKNEGEAEGEGAKRIGVWIWILFENGLEGREYLWCSCEYIQFWNGRIMFYRYCQLPYIMYSQFSYYVNAEKPHISRGALDTSMFAMISMIHMNMFDVQISTETQTEFLARDRRWNPSRRKWKETISQ